MKQSVSNNLNSNLDIAVSNKQESITLNIEKDSLIQTFINGRQCPHCHSLQVVCTGNYKNRKRYKCKECGKYYNDLTKTPFGGLHKLSKIEKYIDCMIDGLSIRKSAKITGISLATSFKWRHRLLEKIKHLPSPKMKKVVELAEIVKDYSAKGQRKPISKKLKNAKVSVIFANDRKEHIDSESIMHTKRLKCKIFDRIQDSLATDSLIVSPDNHTFTKLTATCKNILSASSISKYKQNNMVTKKVGEWNGWMLRFHGVATKYLTNYLHWFNYLQNSKNKRDRNHTLINLLLHHDQYA
jgi:transposase-like protein